MLDVTHLSFTRLKEFAHSPLALHRYIEAGKITTKAMNAGSLLDCLLFTPEQFDDRFYILPSEIKKPTVTQLKAAKPSADTVKQIEAWREVESQIQGRVVISPDEMEKAEELMYAVKNNSTVNYYQLLSPERFQFQEFIEFDFMGYAHRGVIDAFEFNAVAEGRTTIFWDLKRFGNKSGEKQVYYAIKDGLYDLQAAIYTYPLRKQGRKVKYLLISVNDDGYVTPFEITSEAIEAAEKHWQILVNGIERARNMMYIPGVEFWAKDNGLFKF
jgi:hypothetical protein